ncbi:hypothetical protein OKA05_29145 [Luteolibacter arcticus]|uniref:Uncharacterized protein n=1 Tax=Luteolibacter arcticus TaxID=1581411 RepID=A0ABT3GT41_9BACT|nr:hypothetical protein [Luteolibacter arcticus]MCW1926655.1 hypothetical protein [Luteolibacter arcticus]
MRYQTWRRSITLGALLLAACFAGGILCREERWVVVFEVLLWVVWASSVVFHVVVALLQKFGMLEFSYTEADKNSYLYNIEKLHRQMSENRRARKRE